MNFLSIAELKKQSGEDLQNILEQKIYYKYASFGVVQQHIIPKQTLRFSHPDYFNDPFDCNEQLLDVHMDMDRARTFGKKDLEKFSPAAQEHILKLFTQPGSHHQALKKEKENFKICCFSTKNDDILMWSHYADKHQGMCLGFNFPFRGEEFSMYPVRYINEIKKLDGMADTAAVFHYWLTRKPQCWAYEFEMRAISRSGVQDIPYQKNQLKEIFFGCKMTTAEIDLITKLVLETGFTDILFRRMEIDPSTFLLKSVTL